MGLLDTLLGRTKPVPPKLDALFALPTAAITLEAAMSLQPTGTGSVCFRATEGRAFADIEKDVRALLDMGESDSPVEISTDSYRFTWLVCRRPAEDVSALITDLHAVNTSLAEGGFGPQLLCTLVGFRTEANKRLGIVYLYKRGTFYPFAPLTGERRDNSLELQVRAALGSDLPVEADTSRWLALWDAPGL